MESKYTHEDIQLIQLIHHLVKEKGMTIEAKNQMARLKKVEPKMLISFKSFKKLKLN